MAKKKTASVRTQEADSGDCVGRMHAMAQEEQRFNLVIADPPYNFDMAYVGYVDSLTRNDYLVFTDAWMRAAVDVMARDGAMFVFAPDEWVSHVDMKAESLGLHKRRHIIWAFTFGQKAQKNFTRSHVHILYLTKSKSRYTFNTPDVAVISARQAVYKDKRAAPGGKPPDATWMLLESQMGPYMSPDTDTWLEARVCGTYKERKSHSPNQIPLAITDRIVAACSNPGDWVLDPFCGAGGSGVSCKKLGRNWVGLDVSQVCVDESNKRIAEAP